MFERFGGLFGWIIIILFACTIFNYCLKFINKRFGKTISKYPIGKSTMKFLMTLFVRNHKYFGFATVLFLLGHFFAQFARFGFNMTGCIAAVFMLIQVLLGVYANIFKKPRKGLWFVSHRVIALLLILGIVLHLTFPYAL